MLNNNNLTITSYNCRNIKSSRDEILQLCEVSDIVLLQETWLLDYDLSYLVTVHKEFYSKGISSVDTTGGLHLGRPYGGIAILWRKSIADKCTIVEYGDTRIMGIEIECDTHKLQILNVYLPYNCSDNHSDFIYYLNKIDNIMCNYASPYIYAVGDFNANTRLDDNGSLSHEFGRELTKFCKDVNLILSDVHFLEHADTYTYYSEAHHSVSWIDHILTTVSGHSLIDSVTVDNTFISSDHFPVTMKINASLSMNDSMPRACAPGGSHTSCESNHRVKWDGLSSDELDKYYCRTDALLRELPLENDVLLCDNINCCDPVHINSIDRLYNNIIRCLKEASTSIHTKAKVVHKQVPGWNDYCQAVHSEARDAFLQWTVHGRPRYGLLFDAMKSSRARFKYTLRQCKRSENRAKADAMANRLLSKDSKAFWNDLNKLYNDKPVISNTINGVSGHQNVADVWHTHFCNILNSSTDTSLKSQVLRRLKLSAMNDRVDCRIKPSEVTDAIKDLKRGKSPGLDGLNSEHYKYASPRVAALLTFVFNSCIVHNFLPKEFMDTIIVPIVKDKKADITSMDNYRPIAITSVVSKIFETILLKTYADNLGSTCHQFAFKSKHATDMAVYSFKQITDYYLSRNSPVYVCYLDASKAFDRVNHWVLFSRLLDRAVPGIIVRILATWYSLQNFVVRWGQALSHAFTVSNGVRQGGILSPYFFNIYMNNLSMELSLSKIGCCINDTSINHIMYADDAVLLAPSPAGLQKLLNICAKYSVHNDIIYNVRKTVCMCIMPKSVRNIHLPELTLCGQTLTFVQTYKYLGVLINNDFTDDDDVDRQLRCLYARGNSLLRKFKDCSTVVKSMLFKSYCTSLYCSPLWNAYKVKTMYNLNLGYKRIYKLLLGINSRESITAHMLLNQCNPLQVLIRKFIFTFSQRLCESENSIIKALLASDYMRTSAMYKHWQKTLY